MEFPIKKKGDYGQKMPQSHTTDQLMAPRGRVKERYQRHDIQITTKEKQPALSLSLSSPAR